MTFLTTTELAELTGRTHRAKQLEWLRTHDWPHETTAVGRILVLREYFLARLSGKIEVRPTAYATRRHNFQAVR